MEACPAWLVRGIMEITWLFSMPKEGDETGFECLWIGRNLVLRDDDVSPQVGRVTTALAFSLRAASEVMFSED